MSAEILWCVLGLQIVGISIYFVVRNLGYFNAAGLLDLLPFTLHSDP